MDNLSDPQLIVYVVLFLAAAGGLYLLVKLAGAWQGKTAIVESAVERNSAAVDPVASRPIRILFIAANPVNTDPLRLGAEVRAIDRTLRSAEFRDRFDLEQQWAVRVGELQDHLLRYRPDIVHFSGHGSVANEIILEDEVGTAHPVSAEALGALFTLLKENILCVVLNACYSEGQAQAVADSIDCVIGMSDAISDDAAIDFARAFYRALAYGRDIETAFDLGINQLDMAEVPDVDIPVLIDPRGRAVCTSFGGGEPREAPASLPS